MLPNGEVFRITGLEFYQFFAGGTFYILIGFLDAIDFAIKPYKFGYGIGSKGVAIEKMLPAINDFAKLGSPVADMIVGNNLVAEKSGDTHEAVAENSAPYVPDVHRFGYIWGTEIDDNFASGRYLGNPQAVVGSQFLKGFG